MGGSTSPAILVTGAERQVTIRLEGGCFVTQLRAGEPVRAGSLTCWPLVGRQSGAAHISLRTLEFGPGASPPLRTGDWDDIWFVVEGMGAVLLHGSRHGIRPGTGVHLAPGTTVHVDNHGPGRLVVTSCRCPDPGPDLRTGGEPSAATVAPTPSGEPRDTGAGISEVRVSMVRDSEVRDSVVQDAGHRRLDAVPIVHLEDRPTEQSGERWFQVLVDRSTGCESVTQFVGSIPPGRAPDHFHEYEEVLCILEGTGRMWAGRSHTPIGPGSCVYLPRGQVHCVENRGDGPLRLLGVFYPAGSPAARYDPADPSPR